MDNNIIVGFSVFLEHMLFYDKIEEKGRPNTPPRVQLGGSSYNIIKSLLALGVEKSRLVLIGKISEKDSAHSRAMNYLLKNENINNLLLPTQERVPTSYYLIPKKGKTWAFGDPGGETCTLPRSFNKSIDGNLRNSKIRIITELSNNLNELALVKKLLKRSSENQINVLIPGECIPFSRVFRESMLNNIDLLSCNIFEAKKIWRKNPTKKDVLNYSVPYVFITRGGGEAWLKVNDQIICSTPRPVISNKYIGGAGDTATAMLVNELFIKKSDPVVSLSRALGAGRRVLLTPQSFLVEKV